jgi:hypothetical protein
MTISEITKAAEGDCRFAVAGYRGVAFWFHSVEQVADEDTAWTGQRVDTGMVRMVMVGDDRQHVIDPDDVTALDADAYCHVCGQVGCTADGRA